MGSDWLLGVIQQANWTSKPTRPFAFDPITTHSSLPYLQSRLYKAFPNNKQKTKTINFDEDLCGLHKLQSDTEFWEGLLKYAEGFRFGGETRFSRFSLFRGLFLHKNEQLFFKQKGNELRKTKMEQPMTADSKDKPKVSLVSFQK